MAKTKLSSTTVDDGVAGNEGAEVREAIGAPDVMLGADVSVTTCRSDVVGTNGDEASMDVVVGAKEVEEIGAGSIVVESVIVAAQLVVGMEDVGG